MKLFRLLREFLFLGVIIPPLPNTITNGQTIDAVPVMSNFNWIVSNVNANSFDATAPGPIGGTTPGAGTFTAIVANVSVTGGTGSFTNLSATGNTATASFTVGAGDPLSFWNTTQGLGSSVGVGFVSLLMGPNIAASMNVNNVPTIRGNSGGFSSASAIVMNADTNSGKLFQIWAGQGVAGTALNNILFGTTGGIGVTGTLSATSFNDDAGNLIVSSTNPTIASGFGTGPAILANNTAAFRVTVGTAPGNTGTVTMPAAPNGWACYASNRSNNAFQEYVTSTATSVTVVNWNRVNAADTNFGAGDVIVFECSAF